MALPFDKGDEFALDKPALHPCVHLAGHACQIHDRLDAAGFPGCRGYDCLGAGQRLMAEVFPGQDWRHDATLRRPMADGFGVLRRIHAGLELLLATQKLDLPDALAQERAALLDAYHPDAGWTLATLQSFDAQGLPRRFSAFMAALRPYV